MYMYISLLFFTPYKERININYYFSLPCANNVRETSIKRACKPILICNSYLFIF